MNLRKFAVLLALALAVTALVATSTDAGCWPPNGSGCITTY
ncbi:MAG: hypothetical protein ACM3XM_03705 [Mycobacterium leprae]